MVLSMVMAMLTVVALLCGVFSLYVVGRPGVVGDPSRRRRTAGALAR
ncbi:hypothetical protein [Streptacidiphilus carbonis]|jgi:hypothetical protein|nr:hypothetical protein [Streptacidiphilus carbonis]